MLHSSHSISSDISYIILWTNSYAINNNKGKDIYILTNPTSHVLMVQKMWCSMCLYFIIEAPLMYQYYLLAGYSSCTTQWHLLMKKINKLNHFSDYTCKNGALSRLVVSDFSSQRCIGVYCESGSQLWPDWICIILLLYLSLFPLLFILFGLALIAHQCCLVRFLLVPSIKGDIG